MSRLEGLGGQGWWAARAKEARTGIRRPRLEAGSAAVLLHAAGHDLQLFLAPQSPLPTTLTPRCGQED